jgi:aryl-alcohol dehydrogenase-like predicted oxidoreductase
MDDFRFRDLRPVGKRVLRLGLALNYGIDGDGVRAAADRGVGYFFWPRRGAEIGGVLRELGSARRDRMVVATGPTLGFFGGSVRRSAERALKALGTDYLDVFQLFWVGKTSTITDATMGELVKLRDSGKVRAIGVSIHDRARAGELADDSPLDLLMIRYNAAHPGAERDIFPRLDRRRPAVVAYTATAWRRLLRKPSGWDGPVMTPGDCYRFCLSSPHVDVTLCGARSLAELDENLAALDKGPLVDGDAWMRDFGKVVHDRGPTLAWSF